MTTETSSSPTGRETRGLFFASACAIVTLIVLIFPLSGLVVLGVSVLILQSIIAALPFIAARIPAIPHPAYSAQPYIRLSVHVPIHDEPPHIVIATLTSLRNQANAPPYEVIVLDNNTADPALWRPVQEWCEKQGPPFRFFHHEDVQGAKAGALNLALKATDPRCSHVVIVDADYVLCSGFLRTVVCALAASGADYLQFPQAFEGGDARTAGLGIELSDYFRRHARLADRAGAMLLTGTLSVIARSALISVGGWSARTATEDAEMGVRLIRAGYRGRFVDRIVGRGMMALDLPGLKTQRARWAKGNMRALVLAAEAEARQPRLDRRQRIAVAMQLTAWVNLLLPAGVLALIAPLIWLSGHRLQGHVLAGLSVATILIALFAGVGPLFRLARARFRLAGTFAVVLAVRLALQPVAAVATIEGVWGRPQVFRRTSKVACLAGIRNIRTPCLCAATGLATLLFIALTGAHLSGTAAVLSAAVLPIWLLAQHHSSAALAHYAGHATKLPSWAVPVAEGVK